MNLKIKIYVGIIVLSLAMIVSVIIIRRLWPAFVPSAQTDEVLEEEFYPFEQENTSPVQEDSTLLEIDSVELLPAQKQIALPVLNKDSSSSAMQTSNSVQDKDDITFILETYAQSPVMVSFLNDLSNALTEEEKQGVTYAQLMANPKVKRILVQYSKDPAFVKVQKQMLEDENFKMALKKFATN